MKAGTDVRCAHRFQKRLDTGALAKIRVESNGLTSLHYETLLQPRSKVSQVALSAAGKAC